MFEIEEHVSSLYYDKMKQSIQSLHKISSS